MRGVFVTGTDTGVGKTVVSAALVLRWGADYWKPAQTGVAEDTPDSATVAHLTGIDPARIHKPRHIFQAPLSPEAAAAREGAQLRLDDFALPDTERFLVVEGAGGVMVPLGGGALMRDLMVRLGLPVVLVARAALGTINHSLLSIEALRSVGLSVQGVVMVGADPSDNAEAIARLGQVPVLALLPRLAVVTPEAMAGLAALLPAEPMV